MPKGGQLINLSMGPPMKHLILKLFSTSTLWTEIMQRENFMNPEREIESATIWQEVFSKVPLLRDYLRKREIDLLKLSAISRNSIDFIMGQVFENRLWQRYDKPLAGKKVEPLPPEKPLIKKKQFLNKWNKNKK